MTKPCVSCGIPHRWEPIGTPDIWEQRFFTYKEQYRLLYDFVSERLGMSGSELNGQIVDYQIRKRSRP